MSIFGNMGRAVGGMFGGGSSQGQGQMGSMATNIGTAVSGGLGNQMRPQVQQGMAPQQQIGPPQAPQQAPGMPEMQQANLAPQEEQQAPNQMQQVNSADRIGGSGIGPSPQMMQAIQAGGMMGGMGQQGGMGGGLGNMMRGAAPMAAMMGRMGMAPGSQRPPMFGQQGMGSEGPGGFSGKMDQPGNGQLFGRGQQIGPMGKFMGPQQPQAPMNQMGRGIGPSQQMMNRMPQSHSISAATDRQGRQQMQQQAQKGGGNGRL